MDVTLDDVLISGNGPAINSKDVCKCATQVGARRVKSQCLLLIHVRAKRGQRHLPTPPNHLWIHCPTRPTSRALAFPRGKEGVDAMVTQEASPLNICSFLLYQSSPLSTKAHGQRRRSVLNSVYGPFGHDSATQTLHSIKQHTHTQKTPGILP
jgi:hypothetical protein